VRLERFVDVDTAVWGAAVGPSLYLTPGWFRSVEGRLASPSRYVLARAPDGRAAAGAFYRTTAATYFFFNPFELLTAPVVVDQMRRYLGVPAAARAEDLRDALRRLPREAAVSVSPFGYTHALRADADDSLRVAVIDELERAAADWGAATSAVLYAAVEDVALARALRARGWIGFLTGANCVLEPALDGVAAYLERLSSSRRSAVRKEMRKFREHGLLIEPADLSDPALVDRIAHFQADLQRRYGHPYDLEKERGTLARIAEHLHEHARLDIVRKGGELVGYVLYFVRDGVLYPKMVGYDYDAVARDDYAYFNSTYYNMIARAQQLGARRIEFGTYAYDVKLTRGCRADRLVSYLRVPEELREPVAELASLASSSMERLLDEYEQRPR
jgi:uncharacterized protein